MHMSPASVLDVGLAAAPISVSEVIETRAVRSVYQPLIDLYSGETVG